MNEIGHAIVGVFLALVALAVVSVLVGQNAQTSSVISSIGTAFGGAIQAAVSPVAGTSNGSNNMFAAAFPG